jgi:hypothetical protein
MYDPYNIYNPYNPYYNYNLQNQQQLPKQNQQQIYKPQNTILQGKIVDSLEVVKATDIPYDGSISYFPLTDGSAIITKQLQQDGTSKVVIYKPISEDEEIKTTKYITENDFNNFKEQIKNMGNDYVTEDDLKEQIKNMNSKDIKDLKEDIKTLKRKLEDIADDIKYKKEK